jgi:hypothetical protein
MKKNVLVIAILVSLIAVAMSSCGTASSMRKNRYGCAQTRFSIGY